MPRRDIWLDKKTDRDLTALARSAEVGRGRVIRRLLAGRQEPLEQLRAPLRAAAAAVERLRSRHALADDCADLSAITAALAQIAAAATAAPRTVEQEISGAVE